MKLGLIGGGRAAWAFASAWTGLGRPLSGVSLREDSASRIPELLAVPRLSATELAASSDIILFAVSDRSIGPVYSDVRSSIPGKSILFHVSGAETSEIFADHPLRFSLHPLRSLPEVGTPVEFAETLFVWEGTAFRDDARSFVEKLGGVFSEVPTESKPAYHAAAVFASNYVATLLSIAERLIRSSGVEASLAGPLGRLAESAIENWRSGEPRFTGPIARGDLDVVRRHMKVLDSSHDLGDLYRLLGLQLCSAVQEEASSVEDLEEIKNTFAEKGAS